MRFWAIRAAGRAGGVGAPMPLARCTPGAGAIGRYRVSLADEDSENTEDRAFIDDDDDIETTESDEASADTDYKTETGTSSSSH